MAEELAAAAEGVDGLSFYGLSKWLGSANDLLLKADHASTAKNPRAEDAELLERKEELLQIAARLKRAMGSRLDSPQLTKREKPLAEEFVQDQLRRLKVHSAEDKRVAQGIERLQGILDRVRAAAALPESRPVRQIQRQMKQLDADWKEVAPLHDKWEKGRHTFKSNDELQAFRRRYTECQRGRDAAGPRLEQALCVLRDPGDVRDSGDDAKAAPRSGWSAAAPKRPAPPPVPKSRPANRAPAASGSSVWNLGMTMAQRWKAEVSASVRRDGAAAAEESDGEGDDAEEGEGAAAAPAAAPGPRAAPARQGRPPPPPAPRMGAEGEEDEWQQEPPAGRAPPKVMPKPAPPLPGAGVGAAPQPAAAGPGGGPAVGGGVKKTAKGKKGKKPRNGEKGDGDEADDAGEAEQPAKKAPSPWVRECQAIFQGSLLEQLLRQDAWGSLQPDLVDQRLEELRELLPLSNPLGLSLALSWEAFISLEIDGGPKRTSRRDESPIADRLRHNAPKLLRHHLTLVFLCLALHSLSCIGLLLVPLALQAVLLLTPAETLRVGPPTAVRLLQAAHLLLWLALARSLWQMHVIVKAFAVLCACGHSYAVAEVTLEEDDGLREH